MSSAAVNLRVSEAKIISAKADVDAAKMLKEASDILDSKAAMQIRYLEIIQAIATSANRKLVFMPLQN
jgi:erythrocyte band 7 integral membrane protein